ncbi:MAG: hypothetical protein ABR913_02370 [Sedimentisphaerales bacterium]|jgi:hypothetical protein
MQLNDVTNQIDKLIIGQPANKNKFREHIERVIRELEKYREYLLEQWQKAKKEGWLCYDEIKEEQYEIYQLEQMAEGKTDEYRKSLLEGWRWRNLEPAKEGEPDPKPDLNKPIPKPFPWTWMLDAYNAISKQTYFTTNELYRRSENKIPTSAQFYIKGKPKPDPLNYLYGMVWGSRGQAYKGLELLDYQFTLLAIIHDAQNWQAGRERIYFSFVPHTQDTQTTNLADRFCGAIYEHLCSHNGADVLDTIEIALLAVKAKLVSTKQNDITTEKWYRNRTIQAALISAAVLILLTFIGWILNSHGKNLSISSQKNDSTFINAKTKGNLSPAVVTYGPNSQVNIYQTAAQSDVNSENKEIDANRPL